MGQSFQANRSAVLHQYVPLLFTLVMKELRHENKQKIEEACKILIEQGMQVEMFKEHVITLLLDANSGEMFN